LAQAPSLRGSPVHHPTCSLAMLFSSLATLAILATARDVEILVVNNCTDAVWLGTKNLELGKGEPVLQPHGEVTLFSSQRSPGLEQKIWARTGCNDKTIYLDCWKDLHLDAYCGPGTFYHCREESTFQPGRCREYEQGPFSPQQCAQQCVITKKYRTGGFLPELQSVNTIKEKLEIPKFRCGTGNCEHLGEGDNDFSEKVCSMKGSRLTSPATMAVFNFGAKDEYYISVMEGFNVNVTIQPLNRQDHCETLSCKMNPWTQCQAELMDLDMMTGRSFCWSFPMALSSFKILYRSPFLKRWSAPTVDPMAAERCMVDGQKHWCHDLIACADHLGKCNCSSEASMLDPSNLCCPPLPDSTSNALDSMYKKNMWPNGAPFGQMCNLTNWPKSRVDGDTYTAKFAQACPDAVNFAVTAPMDASKQKSCTFHPKTERQNSQGPDYRVTFC